MSIGYACLTKGIEELRYKTCRKSNATEEHLLTLIEHNLLILERMIEYNAENNIRLFRMSSDLIPFGSDFNVNNLNWPKIFKNHFDRIGIKLKRYGIRVSMHPGQYTVLNSPKEEVVRRAIDDLRYHTLFMDSLSTGPENKIILHVGGVYGDKINAIARFVDVYKELDDKIKKRLIIENDDRSYTIMDVLNISHETGAPVVYDNLHHLINGDGNAFPDSYWINLAKKTWEDSDGRTKVHYSQQQINGRLGSHSQTIHIDEFMDYYSDVSQCDVDIMLEVKDKNLSAVKCQLAVTDTPAIANLEKEWARYKYSVLERSATIYQSIRELLKEKSEYPVILFYRLIELALAEEPSSNAAVNAVDHVWGYFKKEASDKEKVSYKKHKVKLEQDISELKRIKRYFYKMALKYEVRYLLQSLYFEF